MAFNSSSSFSNLSTGLNLNIDTLSLISSQEYIPDTKEIIKRMESESESSPNGPFPSINLLCLHIRRNQNSTEEIIRNLCDYFDKFNDVLVAKAINALLDLLTENNQIINFLLNSLPVLIHLVTDTKKKLSAIENFNRTIGKLIQTGGIYTRQIIESNIEKIFDKFKTGDKLNKFPNTKFALIDLLCQIIKNSSFVSLNKITEKTNFEIFLKIVDNFRDQKIEIRYSIGQLVEQFILMFNNRDSRTKMNYEKIIYDRIMGQYLIHLKDTNNNPTDNNLVSGLFNILNKIYKSDPLFFKDIDLFIPLCDSILYTKNSKNIHIKIDFIKFIPNLRQMNKDIFFMKLCKPFIEYANSLLNMKTNTNIRNALLLTLGNLSLTLEHKDFEPCLEPMLSLIKNLIANNIFDKEIFKCLSDIINNREPLYSKKFVEFFDIYSILNRFFNQRLTGYNIQFLLSVINAYKPLSKEYVAIIMSSLNVVSLILSDEDFEFEFFLKKISGKEEDYLSPELDNLLENTRKQTKKYIEKLNSSGTFPDIEQMKKNIPSYCDCKCLFDCNLVINALKLLSSIKDENFQKDIFLFYNDRVLPHIDYADSKIVKKIIDLSGADFFRIYEDDKNLSNFVVKNLIDAYRNYIIGSEDYTVKTYIYKSMNKNKIIKDVFINISEYNSVKLLGMLNTNEQEIVKEKFIEYIGKLSDESKNKNYYSVLNKITIERALFFIENTNDVIMVENELNTIYKFTVHMKHLFHLELIEFILDHLIFICLKFNSGQVKYSCVKIIFELSDVEELKSNKEKIKSQQFNRYSKFFLLICLNNLKECELNSLRTEISLRGISHLLSIQNIDIYKPFEIDLAENLKDFLPLIQKYNSFSNFKQTGHKIKINFIEIFFRIIKNGINDNNISIILQILSQYGVKESSLFVTEINDYNNNVSNNYEKNNNNSYKFYNKKKEVIDLSKIDPSTSQAIISLMKILGENAQNDLRIQIIGCLPKLVETLGPDDDNLIDIILPTIIKIFPAFEFPYQKCLFEVGTLIFQKYKAKFVLYLNEFIEIIIKYLCKESYLDSVMEMLHKLFNDFPFDLDKFYPVFIPLFLKLLHNKSKESANIIKCFTIMTSSVNYYFSLFLDNIFSEFVIYFKESKDEETIKNIFIFIEKIIATQNTYLFYPLLIPTLVERIRAIKSQDIDIGTNKILIKQSVKVFNKINIKERKHFLNYLPMIINALVNNGAIKMLNFDTEIKPILFGNFDYTFLTVEKLKNKYYQEVCSINCMLGFNPTLSAEAKKSLERLRGKRVSIILEEDKDNENKQNQIQGIIQNKTKTDIEMIIKQFDSSNCRTEEDWSEWFKSTSKVLFEQSPSFSLNYCHIVSDYYYPLTIELYNYGFYSVYMNLNEDNKNRLANYLKVVLDNPTTPLHIILAILNLNDFLQRKNISFLKDDFIQFSKLAMKCRALAKSVFYKENDFLIKNYFENCGELINLYYELKSPESVMGILALIKKSNKNLLRNSEDNDNDNNNNINYSNAQNSVLKLTGDYRWKIKLHDYGVAREIIQKELEKNKDEKDPAKTKQLIKDYNECLVGLAEWEALLEVDKNDKSKVKNINDLDDSKLEEYLKNQINLARASICLGQWKSLKKYFQNIKQVFSLNCQSLDEDITYINLLESNQQSQFYSEFIDKDFSPDIFDTEENNDLDSEEKNFIINHELMYTPLNNPGIDTNTIKKINLNSALHSKDTKSSITSAASAAIQKATKKNVKVCDYIDFKKISELNEKFKFLEENDENLFILNLYATVSYIDIGKYDIAMQYINSAKKMAIIKLKSIAAESYARGYRILWINEMFSLLEKTVEFKRDHSNDKKFKNDLLDIWNRVLDAKNTDADMFEITLSIRTLIVPIDADKNYYFKLAKICRKAGNFKQSKKILERLNKKLQLDEIKKKNESQRILDETLLKIDLNSQECLYDNGKVEEALNKSRALILSLETCINKKDISDKVKARIYGSYAIYKQKMFLTKTASDEDELNINKNKESHYEQSIKNVKENILNINPAAKAVSTKTLHPVHFNTTNIHRRKSIKDINGEDEVKEINNYLLLSTKFDKNNYKFWHSYGMFNYQYFKHISNIKNKSNCNINVFNYYDYDNLRNAFNSSSQVAAFILNNIKYVENAIIGFKYALTLGGKNMNKTFQDLLRLIDLFFMCAVNNNNILKLVDEVFNEIDVDSYLNVLPQIFSRLNIENIKIGEVIDKLLIKIGSVHLKEVVYPLLVMKNSNSRIRRSHANQVLRKLTLLSEINKKKINESQVFLKELNRIAILYHESWIETIEDSKKLFYKNNFTGMINKIQKLSEMINHKPDTMYEVNFHQNYGALIKEAESYINIFKKTNDVGDIKQAWKYYDEIYQSILISYKNFSKITLDYVSPYLYNYKDSGITMPGVNTNREIELRMKYISNLVDIFNSKQRPRKLKIMGTNNKEYTFLLKGHEDLRQDERAMQLFDLINTLFSNDNKTKNKNLAISTYSVFPISNNGGLIGWVNNCDTICKLITEYRKIAGIPMELEYLKVKKSCVKYQSLAFLNKVEIFQDILDSSQGDDLRKIMWIKSPNCDLWLERRTNYSKSLAIMSMVGYIIGLGDRHPNNLMMNKDTGKIIHIDFGDCFEIAMKREKFPEKVPFRLTKILVKALEISGIEGTFRIVCEQVMKICRNNKDSLMAIISSSIHDPLISFRLMIPLIMKKRTDIIKIMKKEKKEKKKEVKQKEGISILGEYTPRPIGTETKNKLYGRITFALAKNEFNKEQAKSKFHFTESEINEESEEVNSLNNIINSNTNSKASKEENSENLKDVDNQNNEKLELEEKENQIFNLYEKNDVIESKDLNIIAQIVINRINNKLSGTDFEQDYVYDVEEQVDKLISQATSPENLSQSYLGWRPFW